MAQWLSNRGHGVRVVTAPPYYPAWKVDKNFSNAMYKKERYGNISVWRCPLYVPANPCGLKRIIHLASFACFSIPVMLMKIFWRPDVVISIEPPLFCAPVSWFVSRMSGAKCWLHIQDFEVDAAFDLGVLQNKTLRQFVQKIEFWLMSRFDRVSTISPNMMSKLESRITDSNSLVLFPNWVDTSLIYPLQVTSVFRQVLSIDNDQIVALYSGNMGEKQGLEILIESALLLRDNNKIVFVLCGSGSALSRLQKLAKDLRNIRWLPLQPIEQLNDLLNMADIHLLPQRADAADLVMPSKLTGMLASGRPVISTANKDTQVAKVIEKSGIIVPPGDVCGLVKAIESLSKDNELREQLGQNARAYAVKNLGLEEVLSRFERALFDMAIKNNN